MSKKDLTPKNGVFRVFLPNFARKILIPNGLFRKIFQTKDLQARLTKAFSLAVVMSDSHIPQRAAAVMKMSKIYSMPHGRRQGRTGVSAPHILEQRAGRAGSSILCALDSVQPVWIVKSRFFRRGAVDILGMRRTRSPRNRSLDGAVSESG